MPIQIVSANLNVWGDQGRFEADPSTWGFLLEDFYGISSRSNAYAYAGIYSCKTVIKEPEIDGAGYCHGRAQLSDFRKYVAYARVFVPAGAAPAPNACEFEIRGNFTISFQVKKTVTEATGVWQELECRGTYNYSGFGFRNFAIYITNGGNPANVPIVNGQFYIDKFEIFEYQDVAVACTLKIDPLASVVANDTAPGAGNGSITVAKTGGTAPFEYSKDNGATWQASNIFSGLIAGSYYTKVRETATPTCVDTYLFTVNNAAPSFDFTVTITHESVPGGNDGKAQINVTGTGGPFQYSKDGGTTYQALSLFENLAPGVYYIKVKDAANLSLSKNIEVLASTLVFDKAYFSKNPIPFTVGALAGYGALTNYRIYCETRVEEVAGSGIFTNQFKQELEPDATGSATFQLRQAFRKILKAVPTEKVTELLILTDRIKLYKNYTGNLQNDEVTPAVLTPSSTFLALLGGLDKLNYPGLNYLSTYLTANKKFLTWAPVQKDVDKEQEDYLNYFVHLPLIATINVKCKVYFDDATDQTVTLLGGSGIKQGQLIQIPTGPGNTTVLLTNPAKNISKYEIWLEDQNNLIITEVRTYNLNSYQIPNTRYLMILNSLGAWEVHRFYGQTQGAEDYDRTIIQKFLPHDYTALDGENEVRDTMSLIKYSFSSGYIKGLYAKEWMEYMRELARCKTLFDITSVSRVPLMNVTREFTFLRDQDYERFIRIEAQDVYSNEVFTPDI